MDIGNQERTPGETGVTTTARTGEHPPVRALQLLDPSLRGIMLQPQLRHVIGRQATGVHWQISSCRHISRKHCVVHHWGDKTSIMRHMDASQAVLVNGVDIGRSRIDLSPWTFIGLGSKTILAIGMPGDRPEELELPARSDLERAIQAMAVVGSISGAARLLDWSRTKFRERLKMSATGRALIKSMHENR